MRTHWVLPLAAIGFGLLAMRGAQAAGQGPAIIPGMGPESFAPETLPRLPPQPQQRQRVANGGGYGGGFLELLVTGRDPTYARQAPPRQEYRQQYQPQHQQGYGQPVTPNLGYRAAPMPEPHIEYQRVPVPAAARPASGCVANARSGRSCRASGWLDM